jgi:hypothetical protein
MLKLSSVLGSGLPISFHSCGASAMLSKTLSALLVTVAPRAAPYRRVHIRIVRIIGTVSPSTR